VENLGPYFGEDVKRHIHQAHQRYGRSASTTNSEHSLRRGRLRSRLNPSQLLFINAWHCETLLSRRKRKGSWAQKGSNGSDSIAGYV